MSASPPEDPNAPVLAAIAALVKPLARLALESGVPCSAVEELVKEAFVDSARQTLKNSGLAEHRQVSRISASTGLSRREVTRLTRPDAQATPSAAASWPSEVFTRWITDPAYRDAQGQLHALPRQGEAPSFDSLARSVTQNVHPRSLLDALCQLGVAQLDAAGEMVQLISETFVPTSDRAAMLGFLQDNVGDHLAGAVHNLVSDGSHPHQDQAVFADELSTTSLTTIRAFIDAQWRQLLKQAVPLLEQCIEQDQAAGRTQDQKIRIGLYSYEQAMNLPQSKPLPTPKQITGESD